MQRDWSGIEEWLGDLPEEVETITIRTGEVRSSLEAVGRVEAPVEVAAIRSALDDVGGGGRILRLDAYGAKGRHVVELFNLSGVRLARHVLDGGKAHVVSTAGLATGQYLLQVLHGKESLSRALVVMR